MNQFVTETSQILPWDTIITTSKFGGQVLGCFSDNLKLPNHSILGHAGIPKFGEVHPHSVCVDLLDSVYDVRQIYAVVTNHDAITLSSFLILSIR